MTAPVPAPGWFPDPSGAPRQRYFDGAIWTEHTAPFAPPTTRQPGAQASASVAVAISTGRSVNHLLHFVLTILTGGLWLFVWIPLAIFGGRGGKATAITTR
ncbi:DUF2510 domain-containing protein [Mycobacteroides chelonae]|uniref:DUF2510 domain-containing protein n=1 Tax=Mycobacteroides chelonae TaxID=1774 RepID=UPI0009BEF57A|nr:DUF2510 domain-containing protein [Mycobacteroides chelonae]